MCNKAVPVRPEYIGRDQVGLTSAMMLNLSVETRLPLLTLMFTHEWSQ